MTYGDPPRRWNNWYEAQGYSPAERRRLLDTDTELQARLRRERAEEMRREAEQIRLEEVQLCHDLLTLRLRLSTSVDDPDI